MTTHRQEQPSEFQPPENVVAIDEWRNGPNTTLIEDFQKILIRPYEVRLTDGSKYDVHVYEPSKPIHDVSVAFPLPWFTDLEGFNDRLGTMFAGLGMTAISFSPERLSSHTIHRPWEYGQLRHDAGSVLDMLDEFDDPAYNLQIEQKMTLMTGYSRGGMVGLGVNELAGDHGRQIPFNYFVDPCLEHAINLSDIKPVQALKYIGKEAVELANGLSYSTPLEIADVPKTARGVLRHIAAQFAIGPHLFAGEAGKFRPPIDMTAFIEMYTGSTLNHYQSWVDKFEDYPYVRLRPSNGVHMTGSDPRIRRETALYIQKVQMMLEDNFKPKEILDSLI